MLWLKRDIWKVAIAVPGMLLLLVLMVWVPALAAGAYEGTSGLATPGTGTVQATPTVDATVTALNKEKLAQEVQQLKNQNEQFKNQNSAYFFVWFPAWLGMNGAVLVVVLGGLIGFFRWFRDRQDEREKREEERFQAAVTGLGDKEEVAKIGAAIILRNFLRQHSKQFYFQMFDLVVAHLRLPRSPHQPEDPKADVPLDLTILRNALIVVFKEAFPLARKKHIATSAVWSLLPFPFSMYKLTFRLYSKLVIVYIFLLRNSVWKLDFKECFRTIINQFMINEDINFQSLDATKIQLDNGYLKRANLKQVWMPEASLRKADLSQAQLHKANLSGADLREACLRRTNLFRADLSKAKLNGADLGGADLSFANLKEADLSEEADLSRADIENALSLENTDLRGVKGLSKEQLKTFKEEKGAIIDEDTTASPSQLPASPPPPAPSTDVQAPSVPPAQVNTPPPDQETADQRTKSEHEAAEQCAQKEELRQVKEELRQVKEELRQVKEELRQVQEQRMSPPHFPWPTSKPGPLETPPPPGQKSMPTRTEQMIEVGYNQETGVPATDDPRKWHPDEAKVGATGFDELQTAQEVDRKRKRRK